MAASLNEVRLIGNLGADVELHTVGEGEKAISVTTVSIATRYYRGEAEHTEWHRVVLWKHLAERAQKYLRKGSYVYIAGRLATRRWKDDAGVEHVTIEVVAEALQLLGGRRQGDGPKDDPASAPTENASAGVAGDDNPF
ncbi:single-stranded DNA-binding protein [Variovorax ginsengisoli]|uniref:Single-stranded DNA-binding protein n=1 Tax=Variovorax ginsengisoli TaxID=363844 RepID=A0ABT9SDQ2_9BURK|nr:single-stranded DNA-binding protein [Variovorax ginsengisoli]MDP9902486.1 single-strand DNA-binding protein [Variovorax ginsengisoli]